MTTKKNTKRKTRNGPQPFRVIVERLADKVAALESAIRQQSAGRQEKIEFNDDERISWPEEYVDRAGLRMLIDKLFLKEQHRLSADLRRLYDAFSQRRADDFCLLRRPEWPRPYKIQSPPNECFESNVVVRMEEIVERYFKFMSVAFDPVAKFIVLFMKPR